MTGVKSFLASKTIWGALIAVLPQVAALFGYTISAGDASQIGSYANDLISIAGGLLAIYGRVMATKAIGA